ncbi:MAG: trypsin-like peptidase domain-containing protein, partial [Atopobiaceae bacterium]|nr:trypsin-like peptidase domain-containing protein [Atopobiaceae bacterium]
MSGRPPYPVSEDGFDTQQTAQRPPVETIPRTVGADGFAGTGSTASEAPTRKAPATRVVKGGKGAGTLKSLVGGLVGGAVGALAVTLTLNAAGITGTTKVIETTQSSAGQTISINATTEDATVAKAVAAKALPSVVSVYVTSSMGDGLGSGSVLDLDGNIITNYHVVEGAESISVTINGKSYDATLVGTDASSDLAVVHAELNGDTVTPIEIGDSDALVVGDWVMTIGSPFGLDQSVSAGIVSSLSRNQLMTSAAGNTLYANLIQTDAAINPGNSGGALVNAQGQLVGISTLYSSSTESFAGIGFAIPGNYAIEIANKIIAGEQVTHAYI